MHFSLKKKTKNNTFSVVEEQKRTRKCSIQRPHVFRTIIHWIGMQTWDCRGQWRWTCIGGGGGSVDKQSIWTPTHSPKARHFLFTVASGREEASWKKEYGKKTLETTTGSLRGTGWQGLCGRAAEDVQVPGLFWCTFVCKISISRRQITIAQRPSNDLEDRCEDILSHRQSKQSGY